MKKNRSKKGIFFVLWLVVVSLVGCSYAPPVLRKLAPGNKPMLKKRVVVLPLADHAGVGGGWAEKVTRDLTKCLRELPHVVVDRASEDTAVYQLSKLPDGTYAIPEELIKRTRQEDLNALVYGTLNPVESRTGRTGIWPFRKTKRIIEVSMVVNVVDLRGGVLLLTNQESEYTGFPIEEVQFQDDRWTLEEALEKSAPELVEEQCSTIARALAEAPWSGRIISVEGEKVVINAGEDLGVNPGQRFAVHGKGESIVCGNGRKLELLGEKIGEIRVESVMETRSVASPAAPDQGIVSGQAIRPLD